MKALLSTAAPGRVSPSAAQAVRREVRQTAVVQPASIVHIGVGNFHRSHQAWYLHRLADPKWRVCGIGMLPSDRGVRADLLAQDLSYSLLLKSPDGTIDRQVITTMVDYLLAQEDPWAAVDRLADPATRIVSLTITEGGYNVDDSTGKFLSETPAVVADLVAGAAPRTVFGVVVHALDRRRKAGQRPFTIMSCDNVENNGAFAREAFTSFAALLNPDLATWITAEVAFPNSMVDRITPVTTQKDIDFVKAEYGVDDLAPVPAEPFAQWVLEDHFTAGRPPLETVGVEVVADVRPYELMKLRLLNAGHQVIAYYGLLLGHHWVHDAMADPLITDLLDRYWHQEAIPTLDPISGVDFGNYCATLTSRFSNAYVADTLPRLTAFASDRIAKGLLPVVRENAAAGRPTEAASAVIASWLRYTEVTDQLIDNRRGTPEELTAQLLGGLPQAFLTEVAGNLEALRSRSPRDVLAGTA